MGGLWGPDDGKCERILDDSTFRLKFQGVGLCRPLYYTDRENHRKFGGHITVIDDAHACFRHQVRCFVSELEWLKAEIKANFALSDSISLQTLGSVSELFKS